MDLTKFRVQIKVCALLTFYLLSAVAAWEVHVGDYGCALFNVMSAYWMSKVHFDVF